MVCVVLWVQPGLLCQYFCDIINSLWCFNILTCLMTRELKLFFFQQDSGNNYMHCSENVFGDRIISSKLWPPHSPDVNRCYWYLLLTHVERWQCIAVILTIKNTLKKSIWDIFSSILQGELWCTVKNDLSLRVEHNVQHPF